MFDGSTGLLIGCSFRDRADVFAALEKRRFATAEGKIFAPPYSGDATQLKRHDTMHHTKTAPKPPQSIRHIFLRLALAAILFAPAAARAQGYSAIFSDPTGASGMYPNGPLLQGSDGCFYGTTQWGGANGKGTVFKLTPTGVLTTLASFAGPNGSDPICGLVLGSDGAFYGTTYAGGDSNHGTVFKVSAGVLSTVFSFNPTGVDNFPHGACPIGGLVAGNDGTLYGTTVYGGPRDRGTVFKIPPGGTLTTLVSFDKTNGTQPTSLMLASDGNLYGTTNYDGANCCGTVFQMTPAGVLKTVYSFNRSDGAEPNGPLAQGNDGNFYGTTLWGGTNDFGTIFRLTPGGSLKTLLNLSLSDGRWPFGTAPNTGFVKGSDGNFYGAATYGTLPGREPNANGTILKLTPQGAVTTLYGFDGTTARRPGLPMVGADGALYGPAYVDASPMVIWRLAPVAPSQGPWSFQYPSLGTGGFLYGPLPQSSGQPWLFAGHSGLAQTSQVPGFWVSGAPTGQYAFLQTNRDLVNNGNISVLVAFPGPGTFQLNYQIAGRIPNLGFGGAANYSVTISGGLLSAEGASRDNQPFTLQSNTFTVFNPGNYTLTFANTGPVNTPGISPDETLLVDTVSVTPVIPTASLGDGDFQAPGLAGNPYIYESGTPQGQPWSFVGNSGVAVNARGGFEVTPPATGPYAFLQTGAKGGISQTVTFSAAGSYELDYMVAGRTAGENYGGAANYVATITEGVLFAPDTTKDGQPFTARTYTFTVLAPGSYTLTFANTGAATTGEADATVLIDNVKLFPTNALAR
jgi:uncharacterized repeat protein (TIGR03803 family)